MYNFEFVKPSTVEEASTALQVEGAQALGGGQTLLPTMKQRLASPETLVSLTGVEGMVAVSASDGTVTVGGATTHAQVAAEAASAYPALAALAGQIGDPAVRNRGTIGGSLANNDPAACYPSAALGSGASISTNKRNIAADDYFQGMFETALEDDEIITSVSFPVPEAASYQKFLQPASRFALTGVFVAKFPGGVRVAVTGASNNGVFRWTEAEEALSKEFRADALMDLRINHLNMISDLHGSQEYRAHLVGVMTRRAVEAAS
ncbi:FAD binding domain-containing protein [Ruegeria jejuensis]|uniref:FAD binding domain-containing protein n=1 Tax=Ruegeria jejuensis TaxID=3233338 RepID=UPI00355BDD58